MIRKYLILIVAGLLCGCTAERKTIGAGAATLDRQGHRGARGLSPENTIPSMYKGIDLGATTLELDVVISGDGKVVVSHEPYFHEHITTTPQGGHLTRAEAARHLIYAMTYDSVRKYDVGLKPHPDFPRQEKIPAYKPLLAELLDSTEAYARSKGRRVVYNIEIKSRPDFDGLRHPPVEQFVDLVVAVVRDKKLEKTSYIQSFDPRVLQVLHRKHPDLHKAILIDGNNKATVDQQMALLGFVPNSYSPHYSLVTADLVRQCHAKGLRIIPWTVNTLEEIKRLIGLGVDGIITDYPDLFAQL